MNFKMNLNYTTTGSANPVSSFEESCIKDTNWNSTLFSKMGNDVTVLKDERNGPTLHRELLIQPHKSTVPAPVRALLGNDAFDYVETTSYNFETHQGTLETSMRSSSMKGTGSKGTFSVREAGANQVTWGLNSDVVAKFRLVGGLIENSVVDEIQKKAPQIRGHIQNHLNEVKCHA